MVTVHGPANPAVPAASPQVGANQTRTHTKMTIAAERLAVIATVTLPVTARSSAMGMNAIANEDTDPVFVSVLVANMVTMSTVLLTRAKRRGWW